MIILLISLLFIIRDIMDEEEIYLENKRRRETRNPKERQ